MELMSLGFWQSTIRLKSIILFRDILQQTLGLSIAMYDCGRAGDSCCSLLFPQQASNRAKCGICCCGSQDMLMVVDLVIIICGYAELILGERWRSSNGELIRSRYSPLKGLW